ncbi:ABC transporter permease [Xanthomonas hortorum]|uniref:ABC transporter permease n=1 Tax=Xanthomonas hortorum TaxID=56454 RepID=UPI002044B3E5|nr:ABC transporter permease [Xanthomonas hortorum]MCM5523332.1 ABC transporter permease [Xanthomonas hortorum pv. pelargonii]MCM5535905.1 ABC transporter permease [Xanthomonas hortorum pv. pelargonii]MCM5539948.1 ABC transporter permease [Xanthomonas hortorum pv. pelargonii]MCM5543491.1 ABC transporter permease [Xanthomonas hortorum pv. pelargonii]MCM5549395.1 ABC transporter permease [Xanthomonas hortorum pv. pelargonii]
MNALTHQASPARTFGWLLKREYWEHRGGFVWAQIITGGIAVFFALLGAVIGAISARRNMVGDSMTMSDMAEYSRTLGQVGDGLLLGGIGIASVVLAFVVFFYALGSLYDDRRDRSVLFWKSLPVSDVQTVLSKAAWALLLAPLIAIVIGVLVGLALWLIAGVPNPWGLATHSHPFSLLWLMLQTVPMSLLWSLPTVGWLMFCSAWATSKPFLWAVLFPLLACVMLSILSAMPGVSLPIGWIWYIVGYRGLLSALPGTWSPRAVSGNLDSSAMQNPSDLVQWVLQHTDSRLVYGNPDIWIGAAIGVVLIAASIYLRRRRSEA